jgi:hypothetical protein
MELPLARRAAVIEMVKRGFADKHKRPKASGPATPEQVTEFHELLANVPLPDGTVERWLGAAGVDCPEEMTGDVIAKHIDELKRMATPAAAA